MMPGALQSPTRVMSIRSDSAAWSGAMAATQVADFDGYTGSGPVDHLTDGAVDLVKLDRRLVRGLGEPRGRVRAELAVAPLLEHGVGVCAVGVETRPELDAARSLGCRYAQGYLYSPPVDAARLRTVLSNLA